MFGLAVGDALGAPLEGAPPSVAAATVASGLTMVGSVFWAPGEWTDDTAMALALAESIGAHGLLNTEDLARRYIDWATRDGKGIGNATSRALIGARDAHDARDRARAHHEAGGLAAGNGTVMRATPIALVARELEEAVDAAVTDAMLTHGDPVAGVASAALCAALIALREDKDPLVAAKAQAQGDPRLTAALGAVNGRDYATLGQLCAGRQSGACWTTLGVGLHALTTFENYEDGVGWAISQGGDVDTNAAVAGALLGYRDGVGAIPACWLDALLGRERIARAADGLLARHVHD